MRSPLVVPRFYAARLEHWTLTDSGGVVASVVDQADGTVDITTNAVSGTFNFKTPLKDFLAGADLDPVNGVLMVEAVAHLLAANNGFDYVYAGIRDDGRGLNLMGGVRQNGNVVAAGLGSSAASAGTTSDRARVANLWASGDQSGTYGYTFGYSDAETFVEVRGLTPGITAWAPDYLYVQVNNNAATAHTFSIAAGFLVWPSIPDFTITTPRA